MPSPSAGRSSSGMSRGPPCKSRNRSPGPPQRPRPGGRHACPRACTRSGQRGVRRDGLPSSPRAQTLLGPRLPPLPAPHPAAAGHSFPAGQPALPACLHPSPSRTPLTPIAWWPRPSPSRRRAVNQLRGKTRRVTSARPRECALPGLFLTPLPVSAPPLRRAPTRHSPLGGPLPHLRHAGSPGRGLSEDKACAQTEGAEVPCGGGRHGKPVFLQPPSPAS